jgi:VanZ family protein
VLRGRPVVAPTPVRYAVAAVVALAVLAASLAPADGGGGALLAGAGPLGLAALDKWVHAGAYLAVGLSFAYARLPGTGREDAVVWLAAVAFGAGVELVQEPLATRALDPVDALANAAGATLALVAWVAVRRARARRRPGQSRPS